MSALPERERWTVEDYLEFENNAEGRHEFFHGHIYAMVGASDNHNKLAFNLSGLFFNQFQESSCWAFQSDMRVQVASDAYFYPDLVVVCGDEQYKDQSRNTLLNPTVVIEILSPSTEKFDHGRKLIAYQGIPSLQDYLIVAQDEMLVQRYNRESGDKWVHSAYQNGDDLIMLASIGCTLKLADIYRRISFDCAMSALPQRERWTVEEYLEFEYRAEGRHEFIDGLVIARDGRSERHNLIASALNYWLHTQMKARGHVFASMMQVKASDTGYFYPDIVVIFGKGQYADRTKMMLLNPTVVLEIYSPETEPLDRQDKLLHYRNNPHLQEYVLVAQDKMLVEHYIRHKDGHWIYSVYNHAEAMVVLPSISCNLKLAEIYENVVLDNEEEYAPPSLPEREYWTLEEYLEFENRAEGRHEYLNGQVYPMTGATQRHSRISSGINHVLFTQLIEKNCQVYQAQTRIYVNEKAIFYPDLVIMCDEEQYADKAEFTVINPTVVIEVLCPLTENLNGEQKSALYQQIASLQEYVLVSHDEMLVEHVVRQSGNTWSVTRYTHAEDILNLSSVHCTLSLTDIYRRVSFENETSQSPQES